MRHISICLLMLFFLSSCNTAERIVEKEVVKTVIDSTSVSELNKELHEQKIRLFEIRNKLSEVEQENERLKSETSISIREYDTEKPGAPLKKESTYNNSNSKERDSERVRREDSEVKSELLALKRQNEKLKEEKNVLEKSIREQEKKIKKPRYGMRIFVFGLVVGVLLTIGGVFYFRHKKWMIRFL